MLLNKFTTVRGNEPGVGVKKRIKQYISIAGYIYKKSSFGESLAKTVGLYTNACADFVEKCY